MLLLTGSCKFAGICLDDEECEENETELNETDTDPTTCSDSELVGTWDDTTVGQVANNLVFSTNCSFVFTNCNISGTYLDFENTNPAATNNLLMFRVTNSSPGSTNSGCPEVPDTPNNASDLVQDGVYFCEYTLLDSKTDLDITSCDSNLATFPDGFNALVDGDHFEVRP